MNSNLTLLTINEAAEKFSGLTAHHIRKLVRIGTLPSMKAGSKYLIAEQAIIDFITRNCLKPVTKNDIISSQDSYIVE
jgi:excisionase family DNA binding protein